MLHGIKSHNLRRCWLSVKTRIGYISVSPHCLRCKGVFGGVLTKYSGSGAVWLGGAILTVVWLMLGLTMSMPPLRSRQATT